MKYVSVLLACLFITPALADWRVDATGGVAYQHQVIDLPQDQGKCYCTIFGEDSQTRELAQWFDTCPDLKPVKQGTHFAVMSSNSIMFRSRYAATTGDLPCIRIQDGRGNTIYQCSGRNLPLSAEALANSISTTCLRRRIQPEPQPNLHYHFAVPDEKPNVTPTPAQPDLFIPGRQSMFEIPIWVFVTLGVAAVIAGIGSEWVKEVKNRG